MLTISGKALGQRRPLFADFSVAAPTEWFEADQPTLRKLIELIVQREVAAYSQRQSEGQVLRVLTDREIQMAARQGKISMGQSEVPKQDVDPVAAVETAIKAFEDGLYLVIVDGQEVKSLDAPLALTPDSRVAFVRLTLLAGG